MAIGDKEASPSFGKKYPPAEEMAAMYPTIQKNMEDCVKTANGEMRFAGKVMNILGGEEAAYQGENEKVMEMLYDFDQLMQNRQDRAAIGAGLRAYGEKKLEEKNTNGWLRTLFFAAATCACTIGVMTCNNSNKASAQKTPVVKSVQPN